MGWMRRTDDGPSVAATARVLLPCVWRIGGDWKPMGRLQHNARVDVGQPFAQEPDASVPAALIGAEEEQRLVILLRLASVPKADLSDKAGACEMRDCPQAMSALWAPPWLHHSSGAGT
jgi:hypothetical protein